MGVGANWTGAFAGGNVSAGGGYSRASLESPSPTADTDRTEWIAGLSATKDGITVSGNYSVDNQGLIGNNDRTTLAIGATYSMNPWLLGVTFGNTERATTDNSAISFGVRYSLGAGVTIAGEIQFWDIDDTTSPLGDNQATVGLIGTMVSF